MAVHRYLMPKVQGAVTGFPDTWAPKHAGLCTPHPVTGHKFSVKDCGHFGPNVCFVQMHTDAAGHATISADPQVFVVPDDLDTQLGAVTAVALETRLENNNLPGNWVTATLTWRQFLRRFFGVIHLLQRMGGFRPLRALLGPGVTWNTTLGDLDLDMRQRLAAAADREGVDRTGITAASTLRQVAARFAQAYASRLTFRSRLGDV